MTKKWEVFEELPRYAAFGVICGSMTGLTIGAVDSFRQVRSPEGFQRASAVAFSEMARSAILMASFFAGYQSVKCVLQQPLRDDPQVLVGTATTVALAPFAVMPSLRRLIPYAATLIAVDVYHSSGAPIADDRFIPLAADEKKKGQAATERRIPLE
eukprot:CAMPEP_0118919670 /NCGR_PEP_ID=MMETSP1166-20130328/18677_1 /TAXON_ID=1104430 /ORGANISM="Chrysoreinhardia sp, Strain CCMP3193" /LENGTH=155 /DNA_ID=CAMNT_0006860199 /DNA_START=21 /DNA_END=489 /DNA_ORIENTATION=-